MRKETVVLVVAMCAIAAGTTFVHIRGAKGFNYNIYNYFSSLHHEGLDPYDAPELVIETLDESFTRPAYLD